MRDAYIPAIRVLAFLTLLVAAAIAAAPAMAQDADSVEAVPAEETYVVAGTGETGLALRAGPDLTAPMLTVLPEGTGVQILDGPVFDGQATWYHVRINGAGTVSGYGNADYIVARQAVPPVGELPPGSRVLPRAKVTGYANGSDGGAVGSITASGTRTHWGTVAADARLYPMGTRLLVEGFEGTVFVVEDTGSGVRGDLFDIWFPDVPTAVRFGTQFRTVTILPPES